MNNYQSWNFIKCFFCFFCFYGLEKIFLKILSQNFGPKTSVEKFREIRNKFHYAAVKIFFFCFMWLLEKRPNNELPHLVNPNFPNHEFPQKTNQKQDERPHGHLWDNTLGQIPEKKMKFYACKTICCLFDIWPLHRNLDCVHDEEDFGIVKLCNERKKFILEFILCNLFCCCSKKRIIQQDIEIIINVY